MRVLFPIFFQEPSIVWKNAKIGVQVKLQWFQFPQGLTFENKIFETKEMCLFFKTKDAVLVSKSSQVDLGSQFWNQFARECEYLVHIIQEYKADKMTT